MMGVGGERTSFSSFAHHNCKWEDHINCRDRAGHHRCILSPSTPLKNNGPWIPLLHLSQSRFIPPQQCLSFNSNTGQHFVKCNFSTRLARRLHQNGSLKHHTFQRSRLVKMQGRKQQLKEELRAEEQQVELMMERLKDTNRVGEVAHNMNGKIELGVTHFQASVQRRRTMKLFHAMQCKYCARKAITLFFQHFYQGGGVGYALNPGGSS